MARHADGYDLGTAARFETLLSAVRCVAALSTVVLLLATRVAGPDGRTVPVGGQIAVHLAIVSASLLVVLLARRLTEPRDMERLAFAVTAFDLTFWVLYAMAYHAERGPGSLLAVFVLVEVALRYGPLGTVTAAVVVDVVSLVWPQYDAAGETTGVVSAVVLTVLIAGGVHVAATVVRRQSSMHRRGVRRLSDAFAFASIGLAVVDDRGLVEAANPALATLLGDDAEALAGVPFVDLVEPAARAELERVCGEVRSGRAPGARFEARVRQAEGKGRWALLALSHAAADEGDRLVVQVEDIHERKVVEAKLAHQAAHDTLTGLPNRAQLRALMAAAFEAREPIALLFIDLDRFKWVNDSLGHEAGDVLLVEVADRLRRVLRPGDVVARLGGDEFVVLAHGVHRGSTAVAMADRIADTLRRPVALPGGRESYASASIGIAIAGPDDAPETLLRDADTAMYQAKAAGGGSYALFTPAMRAATVRHHEIEAALRRAVHDGDLTVAYQPEIRLVDGTVRAFEALVRWTDPVWGVVPPSEFVTIAEESDLILDLGLVVLRQALADAASWPRLDDGSRPELAVNVSRRQLAHPGFPAVVASLLAEAGVAASTVCLEVTETALTQNVDAVVATLHELRHLGVRIAIDDFGTGHASLTYLTKLPVDVLKIDKVFVAGLGRDQRSAAIVGAVAAMGRAFGLAVVAEGVEDEQQLAGLRDLDVDLAQGYLFSRPAPAAAVPGIIHPYGELSVVPRQREPEISPALLPDVSGPDLATVLERTFAALRGLVTYDGCSVHLLDEGGRLTLAAADPPGAAGGYGVPLVADGRTVGVLRIQGLRADEPRVVAAFAPVVAAAVERARIPASGLLGALRTAVEA